MKKALKDLILFLLYESGADYCQKCIHKNKPSCCCYVSPTDYSGKLNDDCCIDGMVQYFETNQE